jgi:hypothetical protein
MPDWRPGPRRIILGPPAYDLKHDRKVAIKVLRPELVHALGPERFLREIATTAHEVGGPANG